MSEAGEVRASGPSGCASSDKTAASPPSEADHRLLFESAPGLYLVLLPDAPRFTIVTASNAYLAATMTARTEVVGRGLFDVFPDNPEDASATGARNLRASLDRVVAQGREDAMAVQKYDIRRPVEEGGGFETRHWSPVNTPVHGADGGIAYIIHRVEDVTDFLRLKQLGAETARESDRLRERAGRMEVEIFQRAQQLQAANDKLRLANDQLADLDRAKTVFFNNVSHEFRTPLTLILGATSDALAGGDGTLDRSQVEGIRRDARRLLKLVNNLLDFARLEAGRVDTCFEPTDLASLTAELASSFTSLVEAGSLRFVIDCPPLGEPVHVDRAHWERIVLNLVSNAFKFTLAGEIRVALVEHADRVELTVSDTGTGIPGADLPRVFERFHRARGTRGRSHEGTGIGLAMVQELVKLHGGSVSASSVEGEGSSFVVSVPKGTAHLPQDRLASSPGGSTGDAEAFRLEASDWLAAGRTDPSGASPPPDGARRARILVADDNPRLREYLQRILEPTWQVELTCNGREALDSALREPPDLVLSDVMMPELDGFGLLRELRSRPETGTIPVVLLSARAGEDSVIEGLDTGADDYLVKPFSSPELKSRVRAHLELSRARRAAAVAAQELADTRAELLADLERKNRELDSFNYSVSHDLRAPLRAIDGFSAALAEDCGAELGDVGKEHLGRVRAAAQRMGTLIDDMLRLSRLERAPIVRGPVDLSSLARRVADRLAGNEPSRRVDVVVATGLEAFADPGLVEVVLENLLDNAFKFTKRLETAHVEVGAEERDGRRFFFVRDDGAGFEPARASRLFAPFQRLHSASEYPGTGIGLATVRRIVERHGGEVRADAAPGRGATFAFSLPAPRESVG